MQRFQWTRPDGPFRTANREVPAPAARSHSPVETVCCTKDLACQFSSVKTHVVIEVMNSRIYMKDRISSK